MHSDELHRLALSMLEAGETDLDVSTALCVGRTTVGEWRRRALTDAPVPRCPRCWHPSRRPMVFSDADYAELLGLYLGDGCISRVERTFTMRISLDQKHGMIVREAIELLERTFPQHRLAAVRVAGSQVLILQFASNHLPCLFPQHGAGKKHTRLIRLEPWQRAITARAPASLLRGLFRSDGCNFVNRTTKYEYVSYDFANESSDLLDLFSATCTELGVTHRRYERRIRIYRRDAVALMAEYVGVKE